MGTLFSLANGVSSIAALISPHFTVGARLAFVAAGTLTEMEKRDMHTGNSVTENFTSEYTFIERRFLSRYPKERVL
jgi:hypothetical protein